jgi:hypothetical protein
MTGLHRRLGGALLLVAALSVAGAAHAGGERWRKAGRADVREAAIKDCTRLNGRYGYYGNPWCTPAEQARWDRWSAGKRWVR